MTKKFTVTLQKKFVETLDVYVEADNADQARELALDVNTDDLDWDCIEDTVDAIDAYVSA